MQRYSIHQTGDTTWELRAEDGSIVGAPFEDKAGQTGYDQACVQLGVILAEDRRAALAVDVTGDGEGATSPDGLLPERWVSDEGLCFAEDTPGGRDFSTCEFSWRDPNVSLVPLMLQTESDYGHMGAELAGFVEEFHMDGTTPQGSGRFYDSEAGRSFRDLLLDGRRFGVSVDPTENVTVEYIDECTEQDEDGWCIAWNFSIQFTAYEIGGVTGCPFPCFEHASIILDSTDGAAAVRASALRIPDAPPRSWLSLLEPRPGQPFLDGLTGDDVLVPQRDRQGNPTTMAAPLTIRDDGLVYGHLTTWGQCHVADPWGPGVCASAQRSTNGYADFLTGHVIADDGSSHPTGVLTVGCEHSSAMDVAGVRDYLAHAGMSWANVRVVDGEYGPWVCGVLRPGVTEDQVRLLRGLSLSGEWVGELGGILSVNTAGLPVQRALAAALGSGRVIPGAVLRSSASGGEITKLVGGNMVRPCPECSKRAARGGDGTGEMREVLRMLRTLDLRTRHLVAPEAEAMRASFDG